MRHLFKNKTEKQKIGEKGESEATKYLKDNGFSILDRNYRRPWGELDIIAQKDKKIYFVEVKTVTRKTYFPNLKNTYEPEDNIHPWKIKRLSRIIETYLLDKKIDDDVDWQIDSIAVYLDSRGELIKIDRLEDIF